MLPALPTLLAPLPTAALGRLLRVGGRVLRLDDASLTLAASGNALGLDRLVALACGASSLAEILAFPAPLI